MYEQFIGKKMSTQEIFEQFPDLAVLGKPDSSEFPTLYITIIHIGTPEEMDEKQLGEYRKERYAIYEGKYSRKGEAVIYNSTYSLQDLVGVWNTSVTSDGTMSNERLILCSDGTGAFAEANMGPYWETPITWYLEDDVLTICSDCMTIYHSKIQYERDVIVPCMSGEERHFTGLMKAAYGLRYYREIKDRTPEEAEAEAQLGIESMHTWGISKETGDELIKSRLSGIDDDSEGTYITDLISDEDL